jgi:hypothetical protein
MYDTEKDGAEIKLNPDTLQLNWFVFSLFSSLLFQSRVNQRVSVLTAWPSRKINTSPGTIDGIDLKQPLCTPLIKKIDLVFPTGIEVTARNLRGVTIRDALDAIHKQLKKKVSVAVELCL